MEDETRKESYSLFRNEAILAQNNSALGNSVALKPINIILIVGVSFTIIASIIFFLWLGKYTNKIKVTGIVQPSSGIIRVYATKSGYIRDIKIHENSDVSAGTSLLIIEPDDKSILGSTRDNIIFQLQNQRTELTQEITVKNKQKKLEKEALVQRLSYTNEELDRVEKQLYQHNAYLEKMRLTYENYEGYEKEGIISKKDLLYRYETYQNIKREHEDLKKERNDLLQKISVSKTDLKNIEFKYSEEISDINRKISSITSDIIENESLRKVNIVAPSSGIVTSILFHPNQYVSMGMPLLAIMPTSPDLEIHLYAKSSQIGFVKEKATVSLRYASYPYQKFGIYSGVVTNVSKVPISDEKTINNKLKEGNLDDEIFRITVKPNKNYITAYGKHEPIRPGMMVEADILLDTRHIYEWVFEPILGFNGQ